jgi:hypothetical protein
MQLINVVSDVNDDDDVTVVTSNTTSSKCVYNSCLHTIATTNQEYVEPRVDNVLPHKFAVSNSSINSMASPAGINTMPKHQPGTTKYVAREMKVNISNNRLGVPKTNNNLHGALKCQEYAKPRFDNVIETSNSTSVVAAATVMNQPDSTLSGATVCPLTAAMAQIATSQTMMSNQTAALQIAPTHPPVQQHGIFNSPSLSWLEAKMARFDSINAITIDPDLALADTGAMGIFVMEGSKDKTTRHQLTGWYKSKVYTRVRHYNTGFTYNTNRAHSSKTIHCLINWNTSIM